MYNSYLKIVGGSKGKLGIMLVGVVDTDSEFVYEFNQFDSFNRLVSVLNEKGSATYKYKADGLRLSKTVSNATSSNVTTTHIWDGSNIVLELNASGGIIDTYIRGVNLIKAKTGENSFYLFNAHGDVTGRTNSLDSVSKRYHYDAFGVEKNKVDNDKNPFRYCGEYYDKETDTIYLRARRYNPRIGRFLTEDPIRDGLNWYTYCSGNPVAFRDPTGYLREAGYYNDKWEKCQKVRGNGTMIQMRLNSGRIR